VPINGLVRLRRLKKRSVYIAPQASAHPRNVIYNPNPTDKSQKQGGPTFGWISWVLNFLTYDTMLKGVPGTGTRNGGLSGALLKASLDGIILLRYHALLRRITFFAAFLFIVILLPVYITSQCWQSNTQAEYDQCFPNSTNITALTNYEQTMIANVAPANAQTIRLAVGGSLWRLYMTAVCFWAIVIYALRALDHEWLQVLDMQRVYYLGHDVYNERRHEIKIKEQCAAMEEKRKRRQSADYYEYVRDEQSDDDAEEDQQEDYTYWNAREPSTPKLKRKWYGAASKLRRLRFIQKQIAERWKKRANKVR